MWAYVAKIAAAKMMASQMEGPDNPGGETLGSSVANNLIAQSTAENNNNMSLWGGLESPSAANKGGPAASGPSVPGDAGDSAAKPTRPGKTNNTDITLPNKENLPEWAAQPGNMMRQYAAQQISKGIMSYGTK